MAIRKPTTSGHQQCLETPKGAKILLALKQTSFASKYFAIQYARSITSFLALLLNKEEKEIAANPASIKKEALHAIKRIMKEEGKEEELIAIEQYLKLRL